MKEYRGSIKKGVMLIGVVFLYSCILMAQLSCRLEADNLLRQKFYRQLQPKCFHQVHCNLINDFKIHVQMRQGIILYEYDFL